MSARHWRVGEFRSSADPDKTVLWVFEGDCIAHHEKHHSFIRWIAGSDIAARQPVGENPAWHDELVREAYNRGLADGLNADHQPVVEPVAAEKPGKRIGMLEAACGPERHFDPAAADAELASIPLVPLWKLPELHPRKVVYECLSTMEYVRQGTKPHSSRRHVLTEAIALAERFIEQMESNERGGK